MTFEKYCEDGKLAYQVCADDGEVVFYPRVISPKSCSPNLEWRVSSGLGTVYASTTVHKRSQDPYNVSMIELDDGFRMMSSVTDIEPDQVKIGMRVAVRMERTDEERPPLPVFVAAEEGT